MPDLRKGTKRLGSRCSQLLLDGRAMRLVEILESQQHCAGRGLFPLPRLPVHRD